MLVVEGRCFHGSFGNNCPTRKFAVSLTSYRESSFKESEYIFSGGCFLKCPFVHTAVGVTSFKISQGFVEFLDFICTRFVAFSLQQCA